MSSAIVSPAMTNDYIEKKKAIRLHGEVEMSRILVTRPSKGRFNAIKPSRKSFSGWLQLFCVNFFFFCRINDTTISFLYLFLSSFFPSALVFVGDIITQAVTWIFMESVFSFVFDWIYDSAGKIVDIFFFFQMTVNWVQTTRKKVFFFIVMNLTDESRDDVPRTSRK